MSISRDLVYAFGAVALAALGGGVLRFSRNSNSRLRPLLRVIGCVFVVLGFFVAGTVFWWHLSQPPGRSLRSLPLFITALFLSVSAFWWFRRRVPHTVRGIGSLVGYPVLLILLVVGGQLAVHQTQRGKSDSLNAALQAAEGQFAPEMQFMDASGVPRRLSEFRGQVVLLNFWATTCGPCIREMPGLSELQGKLKDRGFVLVYLSSEEPDVQARFFRGRNLDGIAGRLVPEHPIPAFYASGRAWPISFLISRSGVVRDTWLGAPTMDYAAGKIEQEL